MKKRKPNYQAERSQRQEDRILAALAEKPMTYLQLVDHLHLVQSNVSRYLHRLSTSPRRIRVCGYDRTGGKPLKLWGIGNGKDAVFLRKSELPKQTRMEVQIAATFDLLSTPMTSVELQAKLCRSQQAVYVYLRALRDEKRVYVSAWRDNGFRSAPTPVYARGDKPDVPQPKKMRENEWQRELANPDLHDYRKAKKRAIYRAKAALKKPQNIFSALGL